MSRLSRFLHYALPGARAFLLLGPLFLALLWYATQAAYFHPATNVFDPDWSYLSNSLLVADGKPPHHVHHPGTPLHSFGAIVLHTLRWFWHPGMELARAVFSFPARYLTALSFAQFLLSLSILYAASLLFLRAGRSVWTVFAASFLFLSFPETRDQLLHFKPDLLVGAVGFFALSLLALHANKPKPWMPQVMGAVIGFGMALKMNFVPYLLLAFAFPAWRRVLLVSILSFFFWTIPAWPEFREILRFYRKIATMDGSYFGQPEIFNPTRLFETLRRVFQAAPHLQVFVSLGFLGALWARNRNALLAAGIVLVNFALFAKHHASHESPALRYLMPALAAIAAMLPLALPALPRKTTRWALSLSFLAGFFWVNQVEYRLEEVPARVHALVEPARFEHFAEGLFQKYAQCRWIIGRFPATKIVGIDFASRWARNEYIPLLAELYPTRQVFHAIPGGLFSYYGMRKSYVDVEGEVRSGKCYLFLTSTRGERPYWDASHWLEFKDITAENQELLRSDRQSCSECLVLKVTKRRTYPVSTAP